MKHLRQYIRSLLIEANEYQWDSGSKKSFMLDKKGMEQSDKDNVLRYLKGLGLIKEGMVSPSSLGEDFAIYSNYPQADGTFHFVLYNQSVARSDIADMKMDHKDSGEEYPLSEAINEHAVEAISNNIVAVLEVETNPEGCNNAWEVKRSAATGGYGPTLYDIAMSISPNGLVSDRDSVSSDARRVYDIYARQRDDVDKKYLDDGTVTSKEIDDCDLTGHPGNRAISRARQLIFYEWLQSEYPDVWNYKDTRDNGEWDSLYPDEIISDIAGYWAEDNPEDEDFAEILESEWNDHWNEAEQDLESYFPVDEEMLGQEQNTFLNLSYNQDNHSGAFHDLSSNHEGFWQHLHDLGYEPDYGWDPDNLEFMVRDFFKGKY